MKKFIILTSLPLIAACSLKSLTVGTVGKVAAKGQTVVTSDTDVKTARESTLPMIRLLEVFLQSRPGDKQMLTLLAKSYGQFTFGFLEEDILTGAAGAQERAILFYDRGKNYGLKALGYKNLPTIADFEAKIKKLSKSKIGPMFWTALCWGGWIDHNRDNPFAIAQVPFVQILIDRVLELDSKYEYGTALALKGSLLSSKPKMLGGNRDGGKVLFEESLQAAPNYLMNKVVYAERYAKVVGDEPLFKSLLTDVVYSDANLPEQALANALAKRRAKLLLKGH